MNKQMNNEGIWFAIIYLHRCIHSNFRNALVCDIWPEWCLCANCILQPLGKVELADLLWPVRLKMCSANHFCVGMESTVLWFCNHTASAQITHDANKTRSESWGRYCGLMRRITEKLIPQMDIISRSDYSTYIQLLINVLEKATEDNTHAWAPTSMWNSQKRLLASCCSNTSSYSLWGSETMYGRYS